MHERVDDGLADHLWLYLPVVFAACADVKPGYGRLAGVACFISVAGVAGALWVAMDQVPWNKDAVTVLAAGLAG